MSGTTPSVQPAPTTVPDNSVPSSSFWGPFWVSVYGLTLLLAAWVINAFVIKDAQTSGVLVGVIAGIGGQAAGYWLGSSHSSRSKDNLIASFVKTPSKETIV